MKTLVIGANGQIGRVFCSKAHQAGFPLRAMVREPGQAAWFQEQCIETVVADLEADFQGGLHGCDQVVFTAGAGAKGGPDKTLLAAKYAADHYLMTSGLPYLILLPGRLTDESASHRIRTVRDESLPITISRENVAECLLSALRYDSLCNQQIILLDGNDDIDETFARLSAA